MDTRTVDVAAEIEKIKQFMPDTYAAIKAQAASIGNEAYALVKRGIKGEVNCFYAWERARVVGTPFNMPEVTNEVAGLMVKFGCTQVVMWARPKPAAVEGGDGTH